VLKQGGSESYIGWWHHLNYSLRQSIGLPLLIIGCLGLLLILIKHRLKGLFLLSFPIFFYLHLVFFSQPFPRYILPLIPFFALGSSWFIFECLLPAIKIRFLKKATLIFAFLLFIPLINKSVKADLLFASVDTRIESAKWIEINLSSADKIALDHTFFRPAISQNKEQLTNKSQLIGKQQGLGKLKSRKLKLTLQAQRQEFGYYVYFLNNHPEAQGQFFSTTPALAFDINELIKNGIEYVAINYADRQTASEDFYTDLKNNAELVSFFSPYSDGAIRFSYDTVATTCMPHLSREIYSRIKSGPALEIYKLKK
jgi:hypothetical protein